MEIHGHATAHERKRPSTSDASMSVPEDNVREEIFQHAHDMRSMSSPERRKMHGRISSGEAAILLPELSLTPPADQAQLPRHQMQTDNGLGTRANPINNNCQTTTLKNLFNFYGMNADSSKVNDWQTQLLCDIRDRHGKDVDLNGVRRAFGADIEGANVVKNAIKRGQLKGIFQNDITIKQSGEHGSAASPAVASVFLSEMGCGPEQVSLGSTTTAQHVQAAMDSGKPIIIGDHNTHTLLQRALAVPGQAARSPVQGHVYMAYKMNGQYYVADPGYPQPVHVTPEILRAKLMDMNSQATIINAAPDPSKFLRH